jgi:hypothetical protein
VRSEKLNEERNILQTIKRRKARNYGTARKKT